MADGTCSECGVQGKVIRGLCLRHYHRQHKRNYKPPLGPPCSIGGCTRSSRTRGWCALHYNRWIKYGDPVLHGSRIVGDDDARFWAKVNKDGPIPAHKPELGPCWQWTAATIDGYGEFHMASGTRRAHKIAYEWLVGQVPDGLVLDHLCRNRGCLRPSHLEPVTDAINALRGDAPRVKAAREGVCERGHPQDNPYVRPNGQKACQQCLDEYRETGHADPSHPYHRFNRTPDAKYRKLTETQVAEIWRLGATGQLKQREIAEMIGCSPGAVGWTLTGRRRGTAPIIS